MTENLPAKLERGGSFVRSPTNSSPHWYSGTWTGRDGAGAGAVRGMLPVGCELAVGGWLFDW
jgi:hypothetical protein